MHTAINLSQNDIKIASLPWTVSS